MGTFNASSDQLDPETGPTLREGSRSLAPIFLLARARQLILVGVVVAPIVGLGLFVVNGLFRCRHCGSGESPPVANLRTVNNAEITYLSQAGSYGTITDLIAAGLLDEEFSGTKAGYNVSITLDAMGSGYTAEALPAVVAESHSWFSSKPATPNRRYAYYTLPDAVVRYSMDASLAPAGQSGRSVQ